MMTQREQLELEERALAAEKQLRQIAEQLCGVKIEGEVTLDMVYAFVEGEIDRQSDLREKAQTECRQMIEGMLNDVLLILASFRIPTPAETYNRDGGWPLA